MSSELVIPDDLKAEEQQKAWSLLYQLFDKLPVPEKDVWKIAAMDLRLEQQLAANQKKMEALQQSHDILRCKLERMTAYRQWLRDGSRAIANGDLSDIKKDDLYRQYALDTLSGPTEAVMQTIMQERAAAEERAK